MPDQISEQPTLASLTDDGPVVVEGVEGGMKVTPLSEYLNALFGRYECLETEEE